MQVLKRITLSDMGQPSLSEKRPMAYPNEMLGYSYKLESDVLNQEIASFLSDCGVDAFFGVRGEESEAEWLWINGIPIYIQIPTFTNNGLRFYYPNETGYQVLTSSATSSYILSFLGNPKKTFFLRFFTTDYTFLGLMKCSWAVSLASLKRYPMMISWLPTNTDYSPQLKLIMMESPPIKLSFAELYRTYQDVDEFHTIDVGEGGVVLEPIYNTPSNADGRLHRPGIIVDGEYLFPIATFLEIPKLTVSALYQVEILFSGRKFLIAENLDDPAKGLMSGLVALDDDDPLITEDELMAEVET